MPEQRPRQSVRVPGGIWPSPWPNVFELADAVPSRHWSLVGGLMVQLHMIAAGKLPTRSTSDVDAMIHVELPGDSFSVLGNGLKRLGYRLEIPIDHRQAAHRYRRGNDQVDFLVADHVAPSILQRFKARGVVQAPGGTNALRRTIEFELIHAQGSSVVSAPDIVGALMLKSDAYRADSRDSQRHLKDAISLAVLLSDTNRGPALFGRGPWRIRRLIKDLGSQHPNRLSVGKDELADAVHALRELLDHV
jgi:hypothetical protein